MRSAQIRTIRTGEEAHGTNLLRWASAAPRRSAVEGLLDNSIHGPTVWADEYGLHEATRATFSPVEFTDEELAQNQAARSTRQRLSLERGDLSQRHEALLAARHT